MYDLVIVTRNMRQAALAARRAPLRRRLNACNRGEPAGFCRSHHQGGFAKRCAAWAHETAGQDAGDTAAGSGAGSRLGWRRIRSAPALSSAKKRQGGRCRQRARPQTHKPGLWSGAVLVPFLRDAPRTVERRSHVDGRGAQHSLPEQRQSGEMVRWLAIHTGHRCMVHGWLSLRRR